MYKIELPVLRAFANQFTLRFASSLRPFIIMKFTVVSATLLSIASLVVCNSHKPNTKSYIANVSTSSFVHPANHSSLFSLHFSSMTCPVSRLPHSRPSAYMMDYTIRMASSSSQLVSAPSRLASNRNQGRTYLPSGPFPN